MQLLKWQPAADTCSRAVREGCKLGTWHTRNLLQKVFTQYLLLKMLIKSENRTEFNV